MFERFSRWTDENPAQLDSVIAGIACMLLGPLSMIFNQNAEWMLGSDRLGIWSGVFSVLLIAPLALRRTQPVQSSIMVFSFALIQALIGPPILFPSSIAVFVSVYSVAVYAPRWAAQSVAFAAISFTAIMGFFRSRDTFGNFGSILVALFTVGLLFLTVWALGLMRRARIETVRTLREKNTVLEVERGQQIQLGAAAERARIAREMHDIVAHSLSVMIAQADGGKYAAQTNPEFAATALGTIAETGRAALADMRRLLGVLREDVPDAPTDPRAPQPASGNIESLVQSTRTSGIRVSLVRMGTPRQLPPGAGLTLYRICQESLTNILKHAGPDPTVTVLLAWGKANVRLEVEDDGRGAAAAAGSDGAGMGLMGMKERAALFGGTVKSGPKPGGGFRVELDLPLPEAKSEPATTV